MDQNRAIATNRREDAVESTGPKEDDPVRSKLADLPMMVFGVQYEHIRLADGADLYLTDYGRPWRLQLHPENHFGDEAWFAKHSIKLFGHTFGSAGSSTVYRIETKPVNGKSRHVVLKWNRMAQDVPGFRDAEDLFTAEFNSPFEEFAMVFEMRNAWTDTSGERVLTHKPLAIYVPSEPVELSRLGRKRYIMEEKIRQHPEALIDMNRRYAVIYEWIKGIDLLDAYRRGLVTEQEMGALTLAADRDLAALGFMVRDRKPQHIIVRESGEGGLRLRPGGRIPYALVDFELLERTPERASLVRQTKRTDYLRRQAYRFEMAPDAECPMRLHRMNILGVDYIHGPTEATRGLLWVVGRDASLFDYFLPERWERVPHGPLSPYGGVYHVVTKDNIHLVWRRSNVGHVPEMDPFRPDERKIIEHGFNSPFEEVAFAVDFARKGLPTVYPRAIYMSGAERTENPQPLDESRYKSHEHILLPDGSLALKPGREYIIIWGYWNKPDEFLAAADTEHYEPVDALAAMRHQMISDSEYIELMQSVMISIDSIGAEELNLHGHHKLLAVDAGGTMVRNSDGRLSVRLCNFEFMRWRPETVRGAPMLSA